MKSVTIVSYSLSGNNFKLANTLAKELSAKHITIKEKKRRNNLNIIWDFIFSLRPKIEDNYSEINTNDLVIFVSPVWMGRVASPLRTVFDEYMGKLKDYVFLSISAGGKDEIPNPNLKGEIISLLGTEPKKIINHEIVDIIGSDADMAKILDYKLTEEEAGKLVKISIEMLKKESLI